MTTPDHAAALALLAQITPGPWWTDGKYSHLEAACDVIAARTDSGPLPGNPTRGLVAVATELLPENEARCVANARAIAALPELAALYRETAPVSDALQKALSSGRPWHEFMGADDAERIGAALAAVADKLTGKEG